MPWLLAVLAGIATLFKDGMPTQRLGQRRPVNLYREFSHGA